MTNEVISNLNLVRLKKCIGFKIKPMDEDKFFTVKAEAFSITLNKGKQKGSYISSKFRILSSAITSSIIFFLFSSILRIFASNVCSASR
jgi:hypothetical protein